MYLVTYWLQESDTVLTPQERTLGSLALGALLDSALLLLPLADFNLYPLDVINCATLSTTAFSEFRESF